jgi:hypothetical protein
VLCLLRVERNECVYIDVHCALVNLLCVLYHVLRSTIYTPHFRTSSLRFLGIETPTRLDLIENQVAYLFMKKCIMVPEEMLLFIILPNIRPSWPVMDIKKENILVLRFLCLFPLV